MNTGSEYVIYKYDINGTPHVIKRFDTESKAVEYATRLIKVYLVARANLLVVKIEKSIVVW